MKNNWFVSFTKSCPKKTEIDWILEKRIQTIIFRMLNEENLWGLKYFSNEPLYLLILPYCFLQPICKILAKESGFYEKHKELCKNVMAGYNLIMTLFSFLCAVTMIHCLMNLKKGVFSAGHFEDELVGETYSKIVYLFYVSKYVEFLDTYFLILCNRPVIWLQYLHHIGAPLDMGIIYYFNIEGAWIFVAFNGIIHTFMYYYYACCIMKWEFPLPKQFITWLQMIQFVTGLGVYGCYYFVEDYWKIPEKRFVFFFTYAYVLMNLFMFINFFRTTYLQGKKQKSQKNK